jgi:hypothetical protein
VSTVTKYTPEEFDREFGDEATRPVPTNSAAQALAANAGSLLEYQPPPVADYMKRDDIEAVGCQFGDACNVLMEYAECPPELRHFVLTVGFLCGGDYENYTPVTQKQIGGRMGVDPRTVRARTEALYEWQKNHAITFLQFTEQELEVKPGDKPQFGTTLYRPVVVGYAAELLRIIEARSLRAVNKQNPKAELVGEIAEQAIDEVVSSMPYADIERRAKKPKNVTPKQQRMGFIEDSEKAAKRAVLKWRAAYRKSGYDIDPEEMTAKFIEWLNEPEERRDNFRSH